MTRYNIGGYNFSPLSVGFETLFDQLHRVDKSVTSYPPHNIKKINDETYHIQLAIAGLKEEDIDIELNNGVLSVEYEKKPADDLAEYLHRGISTRNFRKEFTLSDHVVVDGASLENGILEIVLRKELPEEKKPRKIAISTKQLLTE